MKPLNGKDALSQALVWFIEGKPVIQCVSKSHTSDADDWVIVTKNKEGQFQTIREIPKEATDG
jgi:hypothetical protein